MPFTPIDLQSWPRGQMFYYFSKMAPTGYSMTVNVDVTELRRSTKEAGVKFFPAYLWLVTKNLNRQMEFKVAEKDGVLGYYDTLTPLYASFHEDDHTFFFDVDGVSGTLFGFLRVVPRKSGAVWRCPRRTLPEPDAASGQRLHGFLHPMGGVSAFCGSQLREQTLLLSLGGGGEIF